MPRLAKLRREEVRTTHKEMTNAQYNALLETLARLIEAKAATAKEAAQIVREAKTK